MSRLSTDEKNEHETITKNAKPEIVETESEVLEALDAKKPPPKWDAKEEALRSIDYNNLEDAIFSHLSLFQQLTAPLPLAKKNLAISKLELERTRAQVDIEIREESAKAGPKLTEASIASKVAADKRVFDANMNYILTKANLDELEHSKDLMYHREQTIKSLIALKRADWTASSSL